MDMDSITGKFKVFSGSSNPGLAERICRELNLHLGKIKLSRFKSGEIYVHYEESVRNFDVFLVHRCRIRSTNILWNCWS